MDDQFDMNIVTSHTEIARIVSGNNFVTQITPFSRCVETLVDPAIRSEGFAADFAS